MTKDDLLDCVIIGGGPAGLSAALVLGRALRNVVMLDDGSYRNLPVLTAGAFPGSDGIPPSAIRKDMREDLLPFENVSIASGTVTILTREKDYFCLQVSEGREYRSRNVIVATGVQDKLPDIKNLEQFWGKTVIHCPYCHGYENRNKRTGVLMQAAESIKRVQILSQWSKEITVFAPPRGEMDLGDELRLAGFGIPWVKSPIIELRGEGGLIQEILTEDGASYAVDVLYINPDQERRLGFLSPELKAYEIVNTECRPMFTDGQTNIPGFYVAGDVGGGYQQIIGAAYLGTVTAVAVNQSLADLALREVNQ